MAESTYKNIYETEGVFGHEGHYSLSQNRLKNMLRMIDSLPIKPKRVLDLGCGDGFLANEIKYIYPKAEIIGLDISSNGLKIARKKYPKIEYVKGDVENGLPFLNEYFDLVVSGEQIEHIVDTDKYLAEINRVLISNGILVLSTPNLAFWVSRILLLFGITPFSLEYSFKRKFPLVSILGRDYPTNENVDPVGHVRIFTLFVLKKILSDYGFRVVDSKGSTVLRKLGLVLIDRLVSKSPSLAWGLVVKAKKIEGLGNL